VPFFLCLDEMNLAPVEQYFAEYLSVIETRTPRSGQVLTDFLVSPSQFSSKSVYDQMLVDINSQDLAEGIRIPPNFVVIGTVNMDETTHSFSRKVLDRAMTFEMNEIDLRHSLVEDVQDWSYPKEYLSSNVILGNYTSG